MVAQCKQGKLHIIKRYPELRIIRNVRKGWSMAARKHPHLAEKLSQLYSSCIDTSINSNAALAKRLGISRQAISRWTNGSDTSTGDCIPNGQIESVAALFGLEPYFFALELSEFQKRLQRKNARGGREKWLP